MPGLCFPAKCASLCMTLLEHWYVVFSGFATAIDGVRLSTNRRQQHSVARNPTTADGRQGRRYVASTRKPTVIGLALLCRTSLLQHKVHRETLSLYSARLDTEKRRQPIYFNSCQSNWTNGHPIGLKPLAESNAHICEYRVCFARKNERTAAQTKHKARESLLFGPGNVPCRPRCYICAIVT